MLVDHSAVGGNDLFDLHSQRAWSARLHRPTQCIVAARYHFQVHLQLRLRIYSRLLRVHVSRCAASVYVSAEH